MFKAETYKFGEDVTTNYALKRVFFHFLRIP